MNNNETMGQGGQNRTVVHKAAPWGQPLQSALFLHTWSLKGFLYPTSKDSKHNQPHQHILGVPEGPEYSGMTEGIYG